VKLIDDFEDENIVLYNETKKRKTSLAIENAIISIAEHNHGDMIPENAYFSVTNKDSDAINFYEEDERTTILIKEKIVENKYIKDLPKYLHNAIIGEEFFPIKEVIDIPLLTESESEEISNECNLDKQLSFVSDEIKELLESDEDTDDDDNNEKDDLIDAIRYMKSSFEEIAIEEESNEEKEKKVVLSKEELKEILSKIKTEDDDESDELDENKLSIMYQEIEKKNNNICFLYKKEEIKEVRFPTRKEKEENKNYKNHILNILEGKNGKKDSESPSKRLVTKKIASGLSKKIFRQKDPIDGKEMKINFFVDMSGSMSGSFIFDSARFIDIFNSLAKDDVVNGSVVYSCDGTFVEKKLGEFESSEPYIWTRTIGSSEDIEDALRKYEKNVVDADLNIALTDGQLCGAPIDKKYWNTKQTTIIGAYNARTNKKSDIVNFKQQLTEWFDKTCIGYDFDNTINLFLHLGLRSKR
jgi:hypothetical protein